MKNIFIIAISLIILLTGCQSQRHTLNPSSTTTETSSQQIDNADFRNAKWGDDKTTVIESETDVDLFDWEANLAGTGKISNYDTLIVYFFDNDALYEGGYMLDCQYTNPEQYISTYDDLKDDLKQQYGEPIEDAIIPTETASQSMIESTGDAQSLEYGYVGYRTRWETETTDIMMGMISQDHEIDLLIIYTDKNHESD